MFANQPKKRERDRGRNNGHGKYHASQRKKQITLAVTEALAEREKSLVDQVSTDDQVKAYLSSLRGETKKVIPSPQPAATFILASIIKRATKN